MAIEDFIEPEIGIAVAITAAISSPKVRGVLRQAAVYGIAGALIAGDAVSSFVKSAKQGFDQANGAAHSITAETPAASHDEPVAQPAKAPAKPRPPRVRTRKTTPASAPATEAVQDA